MIAITTTPCARPAYFRRCLDHLAKCRGIEDCVLMPSVDTWSKDYYATEAIRKLISEFDFCEVRPTFNPTPLGADRNAVAAIDAGFASGARYVVHVEEDVLLSEDALEYFRLTLTQYDREVDVFSVTAYNRLKAIPEPHEWHATKLRSWFHPWGLGLWRDSWEAVRGILTQRSADSWDTRICQHVVSSGQVELYPVLSRSQNIGMQSSVHPGQPPDWYAENHRLKVWAGDVEVPRGTWTYPPPESCPA